MQAIRRLRKQVDEARQNSLPNANKTTNTSGGVGNTGKIGREENLWQGSRRTFPATKNMHDKRHALHHKRKRHHDAEKKKRKKEMSSRDKTETTCRRRLSPCREAWNLPYVPQNQHHIVLTATYENMRVAKQTGRTHTHTQALCYRFKGRN